MAKKSKKKGNKRAKGKSTRQRRRLKRPDFSFKRSEILPIGAVVVLTAILYARTAGFEFVNWDDDLNITENPNLRYFDWANIKGIFTSHVIGNYNPMPILTFAVERYFFGFDPAVYHITNVALHLVCVFLSYRLTRLLGMPMWGALAVAAMFGLHPMRIESVAWITERKDVLYSAFYFGALIQYVKWVKSKGARKYMIMALILAVFSLFSKIQAVALPLSMLTIDYLLGRQLVIKRLLEKWHYFLLSLLFGLLGIYFLSQQGSLNATEQYGLLQRIIIGMYSYGVYVVKFIAPYIISPLYPYPASFPWYIYASPALFAGIAVSTWIGFRKKWRPLVFGILFFTFNVMFVLQVVGAGQGFLADRFTYIPYYGLMYVLAYYGYTALSKKSRWARPLMAVCALWFAAILFQSWRHVPVWQNSGTLWTHVTRYFQNTALPYRNRAQYYREQEQFDLALQDYERSISLKKDPDVINSRARLYFTRQQWDLAMQDYNLAIELEPETGEFWINRGAVHAMTGDLQSALRDMSEGIRLDPTFANGYKNRSLVYQRFGMNKEALQDLDQYLQLNPYDGEIWYEKGRLHRMMRQFNEALQAYNNAIQLNPRGLYYLERGRTYISLNNIAAARTDINQAQRLGQEVDAETLSRIR